MEILKPKKKKKFILFELSCHPSFLLLLLLDDFTKRNNESKRIIKRSEKCIYIYIIDLYLAVKRLTRVEWFSALLLLK